MGQWMPYVTGGYASGSFEFDAQNTAGGFTEQATARPGGAYIGGGVDWALTKNWIVGAEYRHYGFRSTTVSSTSSLGFTEHVNFDTSTDTVMVRGSYKFNWMW